jgi:hypothetical protein
MATDLRRRVAQGLGAPAAALVPGVALVWGAVLGLLARNPSHPGVNNTKPFEDG